MKQNIFTYALLTFLLSIFFLQSGHADHGQSQRLHDSIDRCDISHDSGCLRHILHLLVDLGTGNGGGASIDEKIIFSVEFFTSGRCNAERKIAKANYVKGNTQNERMCSRMIKALGDYSVYGVKSSKDNKCKSFEGFSGRKLSFLCKKYMFD